MDEAEYCHRLALMYRGRVIALGTPAELRASFRARTLLRLETSAPLETMKALEKAPGIQDVAVFGSGLHVAVDDPLSGAETIRSRLAAEGIGIRHIGKIQPSLEDVFVALIEAEETKTAQPATSEFTG
jgi:ABC-2 type transport system ATP-binding protein